MIHSQVLNEINEICSSIEGSSLSMEDRKRKAVDLAALLLQQASRGVFSKEGRRIFKNCQLMRDPSGKAFSAITFDRVFRSKNHSGSQLVHLLHQMSIPESFEWLQRTIVRVVKAVTPQIAQSLMPAISWVVKKELSHVFVYIERDANIGFSAFQKFLKDCKAQGIQCNFHRLTTAVLSDSEAERRLQMYIEDLKSSEIETISVKISTICRQIDLLDFEKWVERIAEVLKRLYRAAARCLKCVYLDMEQYRDVYPIVAAFQKVLNMPEFFCCSAGITLQAYLPNSYVIQQELTAWAMKRVAEGGAPIQLRIVKGAYLVAEQVSASLHGWPQAPYLTKLEVDANYKRMMVYGFLPERACAVHLSIATHNIFDISFAMLLRSENKVHSYVCFEMLKGMADPISRALRQLTGSVRLYCPLIAQTDILHAVPYLLRRLDESSGSENFLRHMVLLKSGTEVWDSLAALFSQSCDEIDTVGMQPRRTQNRLDQPLILDSSLPFENEAHIDFSFSHNRIWAEETCRKWKSQKDGFAFCGIEEHANFDLVEDSVARAWAEMTMKQRKEIFCGIAQILRERRSEFIGSIMNDARKVFVDADEEVSKAIDFAEYYGRQILNMFLIRDVKLEPKGVVCVLGSQTSPCSVAAAGLFAALATGNCTLFKPHKRAVRTGFFLAQAFWDGGIPKEVLQCTSCPDDEESKLLCDQRINCVFFTGDVLTAKQLRKLRPRLDLIAATSGKSSMIITACADRELAARDLICSAFSYAGQKDSTVSLAIVEAEVFDDPSFRMMLREAAASLKVGSFWDFGTQVPPLIEPPQDLLKKALTCLEKEEKWLLQPKVDPEDECLWSPGIKWNVQPGGLLHQTPLFGPVLGILRAKDLQHAVDLANAMPHGLSAGLQSLDEREQAIWIDSIEAGSLYVNCPSLDAKVQRQPFGGEKAMHFCNGPKIGGPNSLCAFVKVSQICLPKEKSPVNEWVNNLTTFLEKLDLSAEQLGFWMGSVANYSYWWKRMQHDRDPEKILGEDHYLHYIPLKNVVLRILPTSNPLDALRACAAALTCGAELEISWSQNASKSAALNWLELVPVLPVIEEKEEEFLCRVQKGKMRRIRVVESASSHLASVAAESDVCVIDVPVLANGRFELLHFLREVVISNRYHRYGNLGLREGELRKPIL